MGDNLLDECRANIHELSLVDADGVKDPKNIHELFAGEALMAMIVAGVPTFSFVGKIEAVIVVMTVVVWVIVAVFMDVNVVAVIVVVEADSAILRF